MKKITTAFLSILFCLTATSATIPIAWILFCLTATSATTIAWSADFEAGVTAYKKADYATALREWTPLAEQGDASAQFGLGLMYGNGEGVAQDYKTALKWFTLAAEQGDASAQFSLGLMYDNGEGVAQDYKTARKWYTLAAEQGLAIAQSNLGLMYKNGEGVAQDYKTASKVVHTCRRTRRCLCPVQSGFDVRQWRGRCSRL